MPRSPNSSEDSSLSSSSDPLSRLTETVLQMEDEEDEEDDEDDEEEEETPLLGTSDEIHRHNGVIKNSFHPNSQLPPGVHNFPPKPPSEIHPYPPPTSNGFVPNTPEKKRPDKYPRELKKTIVAMVFMLTSMVMTGLSLSLVHEVYPADSEPLPDQILDRVSYQKWALFASEHLIQLQTAVAIIVMVFHKHRFIVVRRVMLLVGVLYLYRSVTMWVTALPKSNPAYPCAPQLNRTMTMGELGARVGQIILGMGLSVNGRHVYCGDFIFSGHSMIVILGHLVIRDYTPKRVCVLHWFSWLTAVGTIILLLLARGHYTIDVIIAYFITTRSWAIYHTVAHHAALKHVNSNVNDFSGFWWFSAVRWFEKNVKAGRIPNEYNWPLPQRIGKVVRNKFRFCGGFRKRTKKVAAAIS